MTSLDHPMKAEIEALRKILQNAHPAVSERIKWNAPSYFTTVDLVTFGPLMRKTDEILLVFHHPAIVGIDSRILTGNYKDRRLAVFKNMAEVEAQVTELTRILNVLIESIDKDA